MDNEKDMSAVNVVNDGRSRMEQIEYWLTNNFWFHYKWYFIVGVFAITLLIMVVVGVASKIEYDWTVIYAHSGAADEASVKDIEGIMKDILPETGDNRRVSVKVIEMADTSDGVMAAYGEQRLYSHLNDQNIMLFILDKGQLDTFTTLGYFEDAVEMKAMPGLYCATNDSPVEYLSCEDPRYCDFPQDFLDEVYLEYVAEHEEFMAAAKAALTQLG